MAFEPFELTEIGCTDTGRLRIYNAAAQRKEDGTWVIRVAGDVVLTSETFSVLRVADRLGADPQEVFVVEPTIALALWLEGVINPQPNTIQGGSDHEGFYLDLGAITLGDHTTILRVRAPGRS